MYRKVDDFLADWSFATNGTLQVLESLSDEKLDQAIVEGHSTLGWLGWHISTAPVYFSGLVGLHITSPGDVRVVPNKAKDIVQAYKEVSEAVKSEVEKNFTDEKLIETVDNHGKDTPRGALLRVLIEHQTHHRGQMTVLLRQAGLHVPGVMGPTKEDRA
ncbi:DinB family protein [Oceanobacillus bengalensis]|uniref:Damage-inducible protein DinB n=1 Tax=Oceanobacillus bengalensis TaxID=1435466 RepID=A0A494Z4Z6_9BACI|nr:DinB family protein [Oceanobacillus bengalensis]RKQ17618.1 damage-inducible protein DinB [Oceanobacillus bengalensis]